MVNLRTGKLIIIEGTDGSGKQTQSELLAKKLSEKIGENNVKKISFPNYESKASEPVKMYLSGEFGETVKPFNPEVVKKAIGDQKPITCRPADLIEPQLAKFEEEVKEWKQQDEDVLSYALFPQVATEFFKYRKAQQTKVDSTVADTANGAYPV